MENERKDIRTLAKKYEKLQTLMCYVNRETLLEQHKKQMKGKASGIDGVTKEQYDENVEENIEKLLESMKKFSYKPQAVRRTYIPKTGSEKLRPLGIPAYEDRLVQGCMAYVLNEIYETKFLDCSYGFRPNRNCHQAIREINQTIMTKKVNYILDADIKSFFDNVDHKWLMEFLRHDIGDKNFLRYIDRFLRSGIIEDLKYYESEKGTPQGGLISPVLANVYLHYVLDLWFEKGIKPKLKGEAYLVRYCDDFIIMFQYENEAQEVYELLKERLKKFKLELAEDKTRVLPFGRFKGNKESFDFAGFAHYNSKTRTNKYTIQHKISKKKKKAKKQAIKQWLKENMHENLVDVIERLNRKLVGMYAYYGINGMFTDLMGLYKYVKYGLYKVMCRRSQKKIKVAKYKLILERIPIAKPKIYVQIW